MQTWKTNWTESKQRYLDWWKGKGLLISMWEHLKKDGAPHEQVTEPKPFTDLSQYWFDPVWRAEYIHYQLSQSSFLADILPVANTHLGPGSLAAILGAELQAGEDTIWIRHCENSDKQVIFDEENPWYKLHVNLLKSCKKHAENRYFVGCPDLVEGLDTLASLYGTQEVLMDMIMEPEELEVRLQKVNDIWFMVFDTIYNIIRKGDEMAFCYFSLWAPGKVAKLQSDISGMISEDDFRRFVQPYIREQCRKIDYTLYHLDGVDALRHLDALLEIDELKAVQWTPGEGQPQGGNPVWFPLYRKILSYGKSVMPCWVKVEELESLLDQVGTQGVQVLMDFKNEKDIEAALKIADNFNYG
jgi:hypothetical protein